MSRGFPPLPVWRGLYPDPPEAGYLVSQGLVHLLPQVSHAVIFGPRNFALLHRKPAASQPQVWQIKAVQGKSGIEAEPSSLDFRVMVT